MNVANCTKVLGPSILTESTTKNVRSLDHCIFDMQTLSIINALTFVRHASVTRILNQATRHSSPERRGCLGTRLNLNKVEG